MPQMMRYLPMLVVCIVEVIGGFAVLFTLAGPLSAIAGIGSMVCVLLISSQISTHVKKQTLAMAEASQSTTTVTREIIDGVKDKLGGGKAKKK